MEIVKSKSKAGHIYDKTKSLLKDKEKGIYIWTRTHDTRHPHAINIEVPVSHDLIYASFIRSITNIGGLWMKRDAVWRVSCDFATKVKACKIVDYHYNTSFEHAAISHKEKCFKV